VRDWTKRLHPKICDLLRPYDESLMEAYAGSCLVISVKNDTEECIEPIEDIQ
jgi:putative SOS response-associated peptidase YedK